MSHCSTRRPSQRPDWGAQGPRRVCRHQLLARSPIPGVPRLQARRLDRIMSGHLQHGMPVDTVRPAFGPHSTRSRPKTRVFSECSRRDLPTVPGPRSTPMSHVKPRLHPRAWRYGWPPSLRRGPYPGRLMIRIGLRGAWVSSASYHGSPPTSRLRYRHPSPPSFGHAGISPARAVSLAIDSPE